MRHMHAFVREVRLTEQEWSRGVEFLNRIGQATHDLHNEGILFSDAIGVSTLVCLIHTGATESASALLGPFWRLGAPDTPHGGSIVRGGPELFASCRVVDPTGAPLPGITVDIWHSAPTGLYENQDPSQAPMNLRGVFRTDANDRLCFRSTKPGTDAIGADHAGVIRGCLSGRGGRAHRQRVTRDCPSNAPVRKAS